MGAGGWQSFAMKRSAASERTSRSSVALLPLAAHTHCLAGDDERFVDQRLREHYLEGLRRAVQMVGPGGSRGRSVTMWKSAPAFDRVLWNAQF